MKELLLGILLGELFLPGEGGAVKLEELKEEDFGDMGGPLVVVILGGDNMSDCMEAVVGTNDAFVLGEEGGFDISFTTIGADGAVLGFMPNISGINDARFVGDGEAEGGYNGLLVALLPLRLLFAKEFLFVLFGYAEVDLSVRHTRHCNASNTFFLSHAAHVQPDASNFSSSFI